MSEFKSYRPNNFPPITKGLIIINVIVYIAQLTLDKYINLTDRISLYPIMPQKLYVFLVKTGYLDIDEKFYPYQIATHLFAHSPQMIFHIVFNMLGLWMFGRILENMWGPKRFLLFYLVCGVGAAACHLLMQYFRCEQLWDTIAGNPTIASALINHNPDALHYLAPVGGALGASGAIMGIFAAFGYLFPNTPLYFMFIPIPIKAKWAVLAYAVYDLFGGVTSNTTGDNVAHFAHLGGALTGLILVFVWNRTDRRRFY